MTAPDIAPLRANETTQGPSLAPWAILAIAVVVVCGGDAGGSRLWHAACEIACLPLLILAARRITAAGGAAAWRAAPMMIAAAAIALPLLQLIPLPPAVWMRLPGRELAARVLSVSGLSPPWAPLSLAPGETVQSALAMIPPLALFLGAYAMTSRERRVAAGAWFALALASLGLGMAQIAAGEAGGLYLHPGTPGGYLLGFFANRNHLATLLLALTPLAAQSALRRGRGRRLETTTVLAALLLPAAVIGLVLIRSRAGLILAAPALIACGLLALRRQPKGGLSRYAALAGGLGLAAVGAGAVLMRSDALARFSAPLNGEFRFQAWPHVIEAVRAVFPAGAGMGTFSRVYATVEPLALLSTSGFEHAHNEYLELALEGGVLGVAILAAFLAWLAWASLRAWRRPDSVDRLAAAASAAVALILAHAATDYSLRTLSVASLLGFACGLLAARRTPRSDIA